MLIQPLKLPLPPTITEAIGVFQSDIIIRTAIVAAIADLRANPWLLDFAFASLPRDTLSVSSYGESEVNRAKEWFAKTDIKVLHGARPPDGAPPPFCVTIHLMESNEVENTLADIHYEPSEDLEAAWAPLTPRFDAVGYSALTGIVTLPSSIASSVTLSTSMAITDKIGKLYPILEVLEDSKIQIQKGLVADFRDSVIQPGIAPYRASLEGAAFRESFSLGCHAVGEPVFLIYLHSIIVFCLLRYRQSLLEARGFERTFISSTDFRTDVLDSDSEFYFSRYINISGNVRHVWPKAIEQRILSATGVIQISGLGNAVIEEPSIAGLDDLSWIGDADSIGTLK